MRQIISAKLWIGNGGDIRNIQRLYEMEVRAVVDLAYENTAPVLPREFLLFRIPLIDGPSNPSDLLSMAVETVASLIRREISTLVTCGAGMSRSPAVVAAALAICSTKTPEQSMKKWFADMPLDVSPALWADITRIFSQ